MPAIPVALSGIASGQATGGLVLHNSDSNLANTIFFHICRLKVYASEFHSSIKIKRNLSSVRPPELMSESDFTDYTPERLRIMFNLLGNGKDIEKV